MFEVPGITERHQRNLAALTALAMNIAREIHQRVLETRDTQETVDLALAFQRVSRVVRQSIALEDRIEERMVKRIKAHDEAERTQRKVQVRAAVRRAARDRGGEATERLLDDLDEVLEEEILGEALTEEDLEAHVARLCRDLGVEPPGKGGVVSAAKPKGRDGEGGYASLVPRAIPPDDPDDPREAAETPPAWRNSA